MQDREAAGAHSEWMTLRQAAFYLGVSEPTLRKWTDAGRLHVFRTPGGHRRFRVSELERFRDAHLEAQFG